MGVAVLGCKIKDYEKIREVDVEGLIKSAKEGKAEAVNTLIERYKYLIIKESAKYHIPGYEFEDLVQHGYLSVIKAVHKYKLGSSSYDGYIINAIRTNYKDLLRGKIKHNREIPDSLHLDINSADFEFTLEDQIIAYEQVKKLYKALDKLSKEERDIIEKFYLKGETLKEIACDIDESYYKTVRRKEKAIMKLRDFMK